MNNMHLYRTDIDVIAAESAKEAMDFWVDLTGAYPEDREIEEWEQIPDHEDFTMFYFEDDWESWEDKSEFDGATVEVHERGNFTVTAPAAWWVRNITKPRWMGSKEY